MSDREYTPEIKARLKELAQEPLYQKRGPRSYDHVGKRYGMLVIQRIVGHAGKRAIVLSHCDCGGARIGTLDSLKSGTVSCGCAQEKQKPVLKEQRIMRELMVAAAKRSILSDKEGSEPPI